MAATAVVTPALWPMVPVAAPLFDYTCSACGCIASPVCTRYEVRFHCTDNEPCGQDMVRTEVGEHWLLLPTAGEAYKRELERLDAFGDASGHDIAHHLYRVRFAAHTT